ncbi:outer membrane beta-barrel family protein [uncultured Croceitalea sp.]|uniref:outer membrane beta-barrel family protein n=1 Tax=uncultured Croceitalea sp. TaxID=1798908 RepID=UPI003306305F
MKNPILPILLICFTIGSCFSQTFKIRGKVVNTENELVPFANILLLNASDSTFVKGTSASENGVFELTGIEPDLYLLQASYIGTGSKPLALDVKKDISLGALIIPSTTENLDEVVVTARRPTVQRLSDRLVFNVENTVVSQGSSWDILKSTPGVIVNQNDLQIRGQSATVYLNDRKVQLSGQEVQDLLQGLTGTVIKSVEVIANPPARYDAEGGPILNIVTSKSIVPGYKGSVNGSYTQAIFPKFNLGTSHYYKTDKLNLFANYAINPKKELKKKREGIDFINDSNSIFSTWETNAEEIKRTAAHNGTFILDYDFDDKNSLNFTSNLSFNPNQERQSILDTEITNTQNQIDSTFVTDNFSDVDNTNLAFDLSYIKKLNKEGSQLSINTHFTNYDGQLLQRINSTYFDANQMFIRDFGFTTASDQNIKIFTGQLDYATPIGSASFESGLKYSSIDSENTIDYFDFSGNGDTVDSSLSDNFLYDEKVYAGYFSFVKNWEKWSMKLGLRGELTEAAGTSETLNQTNTQDFFEAFPSFYLLYTASEKHSFSFDYGRGVERPRYNDLNPFRFFDNENNFEEGNLTLRPNFSNNFNLNYTFNSEFFLDFYYRDNGQFISRRLVFQDNENQTLRASKQNVLESTSYGIDFTVSKSILPFWSTYTYLSIFYEDETFLAEESGNQPFTNDLNGFYLYFGNYLNLAKDGTLTGEVTLTHFSNYLFGSYIQSPTTNLNIGLRKSLWKNRAIISIGAEDILRKANARYSSQYLNQDNFYRTRYETQFIRVGFTYNFGNFRLQDNERGIDKKERDRLSEE